MRVAVVVAAMLFCAPVFAQDVKLKSVTNSIGMVLIEIPEGKFRMGGDPSFHKNVYSFELGKYEVTQGQWKSVMGTEPWGQGRFVKADKDCPATSVSHYDAVEFCQKLTAIERKSGKLKVGEREYRLPTEAEWEYACRAGTETAFSFGDDESKLGEYAWFDGNARNAGEKYAHKVGLKKPNPWGLHDMYGNVWEWCDDWYSEAYPYGLSPSSGSARVYRGGSWWSNPGLCRSASRSSREPRDSYFYLSLRVARTRVEERRPMVKKAEPVNKVESVTNSIGMELIELQAGKFKMIHRPGVVTLTKPFSLGKTEVTQGQWKSVMGTKPWKGMDEGSGEVKDDKDYPATYVSYYDAVEFCETLTELDRDAGKLKAGEEYRLPTSAEWEYACSAGTTTAEGVGTFELLDGESKLGEYAWFNGNARNAGEKYAHKVGLKKPNPWGLHDMYGNVWEWCSDRYDDKSSNDQLYGGTDPVGPKNGDYRESRGGSFENNARACQSAPRLHQVRNRREASLGFRVARSQSAQ